MKKNIRKKHEELMKEVDIFTKVHNINQIESHGKDPPLVWSVMALRLHRGIKK